MLEERQMLREARSELLERIEQIDQSVAIARIVAIAPGVDASKGEFPIAGCDHSASLLDDLFVGAADALSSHAGYDAVGAVLIAAVLHLKHAAGASSFDQAIY